MPEAAARAGAGGSRGAGRVPKPDLGLAARLFDELRRATFDGTGVTRATYGEGEQIAHDLVARAGRDLGLEVKTDFAGNLYLTLAGRDRRAKRLILGSHLDSVPQGGNFDGAAGVLAGVSVLAGFRAAGAVPGRDVTVMAIRGEESVWFPYGYIGSRAALGLLPPEVPDTVRRSDSGRTLAEHMAGLGFDPAALRRGERALAGDDVRGYLEVHIEQGPVLVEEGAPVAVVIGLQGNSRWRRARIDGAYGHSGTVPRRLRRDAVAAFIDFAARVRGEWDRLEAAGERLLVTFCTVHTDPVRSGMVKIAGEVDFGLDVSSFSAATIARMTGFVETAASEVAARHRVAIDLGANSGVAPFACDAGLRAGLVRAAEDCAVPFREIGSGAGHDTLAFGEAGIPAAMLFIRNRNGSHNPDEAMEIDDFAAACRVLARFVFDFG
ncbi:MAG: hydantoinase/carbamoylase family amidase [Proteobacteria bacterium]|nr:hydantoinase/carbamoylase family amidase [Pseudomonadota bacterium]